MGLRGYRPQQAQRLADQRKEDKTNPRISDTVWADAVRLLQQAWRPEQISLWLKANDAIAIRHEWSYQYMLQDKLLGGDLYRHLRCQKQRRKRHDSDHRRGQ